LASARKSFFNSSSNSSIVSASFNLSVEWNYYKNFFWAKMTRTIGLVSKEFVFKEWWPKEKNWSNLKSTKHFGKIFPKIRRLKLIPPYPTNLAGYLIATVHIHRRLRGKASPWDYWKYFSWGWFDG
jgi:hypothetical protein